MALSVAASIEALLFAAGEPIPRKRLMSLLSISAVELDAAIAELGSKLAGHGVALIEAEDALELRTAPEAAALIKKLYEAELSRDLGKAGLETLAIILYRKAVPRSDVDWIRGVNSSQTIRSLLLRGLVERIEDPSDKRRFLYKATTDALAHLGVRKADDLPRYAELSKEAEAVATAAEASAGEVDA